MAAVETVVPGGTKQPAAMLRQNDYGDDVMVVGRQKDMITITIALLAALALIIPTAGFEEA
ncbi:MAG: hypothetical protein M3299_01455 [Thermoproteota archaeon]|nr:hypothetical protein [Thermoproteota archaeon]